MKFTGKSAAIVAALAMATTGVFALNQTEKTADAATVATVHQGVTARLYTQNGSLITNRALAPNTAWQVGKISNINGETMYQVSTNEYLKASDSSINGQQPASSNKRVAKAIFGTPTLYRDDTNRMANRSLAKGSAWQVGKFVRNKNNQEFIQVSTHEYADAALFSYNVKMTNPTYIPDFGTNTNFTVIKVGNGDLGGNTATTTPSTDTNQGGRTTTTTPSTPNKTPDTNTSTSTDNGSKVAPLPASSDVQAAVFASINAERASRGLGQLTLDPTLNSIAAKRAYEDVASKSHIRPDGTHWYAELKQVAPSYIARGENLFSTPWKDLSIQTPQHYAEVEMNNQRGEGVSSTWNHYSAIIDPQAHKVGVGIYIDQSTGNIYTAEDFAG